MDLERLVNVADFERVAAERLHAGALGYFAGGAGDERTLRENVAAYSRRRLWPRVLVDVSEVTTTTTVLGRQISSPVIVAPVAFQKLAHPDGEAGMARAAAAAGTIMTLSTIATTGPAEVAAAAPGAPRWFQLYCFRDRGVTRALLDEAIENGYEAIALTVDAPRAGRRERDFRTGFRVDATAPAVAAAVGSDAELTPQEIFALVDPALDWDDLEELTSDCSIPVLVKGLVRGDDADLAMRHGAAGVVVSNHGGRQLDSAPATLDALEEVLEGVQGRGPVLIDGGVRRGTDVVTALALGAAAVLVGRPALWGLAAGGEAGARRVLDLLREEVELALVLCGASSPAALTPDLVRQGPAVDSG